MPAPLKTKATRNNARRFGRNTKSTRRMESNKANYIKKRAKNLAKLASALLSAADAASLNKEESVGDPALKSYSNADTQSILIHFRDLFRGELFRTIVGKVRRLPTVTILLLFTIIVNEIKDLSEVQWTKLVSENNSDSALHGIAMVSNHLYNACLAAAAPVSCISPPCGAFLVSAGQTIGCVRNVCSFTDHGLKLVTRKNKTSLLKGTLGHVASIGEHHTLSKILAADEKATKAKKLLNTYHQLNTHVAKLDGNSNPSTRFLQ